MNRDLKIKKLHKQGLSYSVLAKKFNLSRARIGQICTEIPTKYCKKHNKRYKIECPLCKIDNYYKDILMKNGNILEEIKQIKRGGRKAENVRKAQILVTELRDRFNFSFRRIGQLLGRHYSSIIHLYSLAKKKNERRKNN